MCCNFTARRLDAPRRADRHSRTCSAAVGCLARYYHWSDDVCVPGQMVLDNRTYDQLAGKWRDLFDRLKWDIIKSVIKSVSGLQGKKVKASQRTNA